MPSFRNRQFGQFEYQDIHVLRFPDGIIGFEELKNFIVIHDEDSEPFRWLVSLDDGDIHFPVLEPSAIMGEYPPEYHHTPDQTVFVIASLRDKPEDSTVNLRSPVVIDPVNKTGRQVILEDDSLDMRFRFLAGAGQGKD